MENLELTCIADRSNPPLAETARGTETGVSPNLGAGKPGKKQEPVYSRRAQNLKQKVDSKKYNFRTTENLNFFVKR